jgi:hypothetical protein
MHWRRDLTGRFAYRPHFDPAEIESETWAATASFHLGKYGRRFSPPWKTEDLGCLIEERAERLDLYADLRATEGETVEGRTTFRRGCRPAVEIDQRLSSEPRLQRRLRMTLAHEFIHVLFHGPLWAVQWEIAGGPSLFCSEHDNAQLQSVSHRDGGGSGVDWLEWQAAAGAGALLSPQTARPIRSERCGWSPRA